MEKRPEADRTVMDRLSEKIGRKDRIVSLVLLLVQGFLVPGLFRSRFSSRAGGRPCPETKPGDPPFGSPGDGGGVRRRGQGPVSDREIPGREGVEKGDPRPGDCPVRLRPAGELCPDRLIRTWPERKPAPAVLARILTSAGYLLMAGFPVVLIREILQIRRERKAG